MKFEYAFEGMKLKVLDETFAGKVLEFYSRNREEFDRYENLPSLIISIQRNILRPHLRLNMRFTKR